MGGSVSVTVNHLDTSVNTDKVDQESTHSINQPNIRQNKHIFDIPSSDDFSPDVNNNIVELDDNTSKLLTNAFSGFDLLQSRAEEFNPKMDMLIHAMQREEFSAGYLLIIEGESGSKLYVVESGELEVSINGEVIRQLSRGAMMGELSLLYDAPRSATVKCLTNSVVWSLRRDKFKQIQASSSSYFEIERSRWLINCPELAVLSEMNLSRLVGSLQNKLVSPNEKIYVENAVTSTIILIEKGSANVFSSKDFGGMLKDDIEKSLQIYRPRSSNLPSPEFKTSADLLSRKSEIRPPDALSSKFVCEVGPGCLLGLGALRGKALLADGWVWISNNENSDGVTAPDGRAKSFKSLDGAVCPFTLISNEDLVYHYFTVDGFENLFGSVTKILRIGNTDKDASSGSDKIDVKSNEIDFDSTKFKMKCILGLGSFGMVVLAEYPHDDCKKLYALKCLSKVAVVETGQLRHVLDERKILAMLNNKFVLKLFGVYQTPSQLIMVTEPLEYGDLWGVIYETIPYCLKGYLDKTLATFYAASLILALDHIHRAGVVYRDLKPENILLDKTGYIRIIDFGFAKSVPYLKADSNGVEKIYSKTYTLCGTPEYLSPELIFNLGHDQSSDLWALGVLIHEMFLSVTPFVPSRSDNVTELFTNIALVKKNGLQLSDALDHRTGDSYTRDLVTQLLSPEPLERYGTQGGMPSNLLSHPFFDDFNIEGLENGSLVSEFIPAMITERSPVPTTSQVKSFKGDQKLFEDF